MTIAASALLALLIVSGYAAMRPAPRPLVQQDIPLTMFVYPVLPQAELPLVFREHTAAPVDPVTLDPAIVAANRDRWIEEWTAAVLR